MIISRSTEYLFDNSEDGTPDIKNQILLKHKDDKITEKIIDKFIYITCVGSINTDYEEL